MRKWRTILGLGGSDHDVNACIVADGKVAVAIEEERISRRKYGIGGNLMEMLGSRYALDAAHLSLDAVDEVVIDSILPRTAWLPVRTRARPVNHHLCHAAAAFFTSGFESAAILVVDNAGDLVEEDGCRGIQSATWYRGCGREITPVGRVLSTNWREGPLLGGLPYQRGDGDHSLGHFYKKVTGRLGYRYPRGVKASEFYFPEDGITMGLAAYAEPQHMERFLSFVELLPEGQFRINLCDGGFDAMLQELLPPGTDDFQRRAILASSAQAALEKVLQHLIAHLLAVTGEKRLCLSGGVAMNSSANGKVARLPGVEALYVPPVPGDNGTALGAALWAASRDPAEPVPSYSVYAGKTYGEAEIEAALAGLDQSRYVVRIHTEEELLRAAAELLARGAALGWFEGGAESGRRALGHRSIFAAPSSIAIRDRLNGEIKRREWFRPFAPVVLESAAPEYFELTGPSPYMQIVARVRPERRSALAGVTHVDGTARVQTVSPSQNPRLSRLLEAFSAHSGLPVLLNTSFNGAGEPIIETPREAIAALDSLGLDALVLENRLITRA